MPTFAFQARNQAGQRVTGTREASTQEAALEALRALGLFVTHLAPVGKTPLVASAPAVPRATHQAAPPMERPLMERPLTERPLTERPLTERPLTERPLAEQPRPERPQANLPPGMRGPAPQATPAQATPEAPAAATPLTPPPAPHQPLLRANAKEMALFFRQMHAMINAGTGLAHALGTMGQHAPNAALRHACGEMGRRAVRGVPWSESMRAYPGLFTPLAVGMISAGEAGGFLDRMCLRLSEYSERDYDIEQTVKRETWYPKLLVGCSILIPGVSSLVVASLKGGSVFGAFATHIGLPLLLVAAVWFAWKTGNRFLPLALRDNALRSTLDGLKLALPVAGKTARGLATAKFCRALGALYSAGMGPHRAVAMSAEACGNTAIAASVRRIIPDLERGRSMTEALHTTGHFPPIALQMLRTGEESGNIDGQLEKVAEFLEADAETAIKQSVKLLGVAVFLLVAAYIGLQVVQFWSGYADSLMGGADAAG